MKDTITEARLKIDEAHKTIRKLNTFITSAQEICEHKWEDAPDLFHPHNGDDYYRCSICGKTR